MHRDAWQAVCVVVVNDNHHRGIARPSADAQIEVGPRVGWCCRKERIGQAVLFVCPPVISSVIMPLRCSAGWLPDAEVRALICGLQGEKNIVV